MTIRYLLVMIACLSCLSSAWADSEWSQPSVTEGISLYTRDTSASPIKEVKAVMTVEGTLSGVTKLIMNANATPEWVFGVEKSEVIKSSGGHDVLVRNVIGLPWPLADRDAINRMTVRQDASSKRVTIDMINEPDAVPAVEDVVRMAVADGQWTLLPLTDGKVEVTQVYRADPGGNVPDWVINMFVLEGPVATFKEMQKMLTASDYTSS